MTACPTVKSWGGNRLFRRRFFDLTLREIFSPSKALVCDFAEKNATRSDKEEEVGAAPCAAPLPPCLGQRCVTILHLLFDALPDEPPVDRVAGGEPCQHGDLHDELEHRHVRPDLLGSDGRK